MSNNNNKKTWPPDQQQQMDRKRIYKNPKMIGHDYRRLNTIIIIFCSPPFLFCFYTHKHTVDLSILYVVDLVFFFGDHFWSMKKNFFFLFLQFIVARLIYFRSIFSFNRQGFLPFFLCFVFSICVATITFFVVIVIVIIVLSFTIDHNRYFY